MQIKRRRNKASKFIPNLQKILSEKNSGAIWKQDGKSFVLNNISNLISNSLTKYFRHSNISSFIRQLNLYGFKKIVGEDVQENTYFHQKFKKNYITQLKPMRSFYNQQKYGRPKKTKKSQTDRINVSSIQSNEQPDCLAKTAGLQVPFYEFYQKQKIAILQNQNQRLKTVEQQHIRLLNHLQIAQQQFNLYGVSNSLSTNNLLNFLSQSQGPSSTYSQAIESYPFNLQNENQSIYQFLSNYQNSYCFPLETNL